MHPLIFPFFEADGGVIEPESDTTTFNCIAWVLGFTDHPWWPDDDGYWPEGVPREVTIEAFVLALATVGYAPCETSDLEPGFEKVALYAKDAIPTHAARQLPNGKWTSKLGKGPCARHNTPQGVEGPLYGQVIRFLRRPIAPVGG